jgi:diguanylate cyclase (GGDEF)-like protein
MPAGGDRWHILRTAAEHIRLALSNLRMQESLRAQTIRDPLTGLYNRRYLYEFLDREISRAKRTGNQLGLIMLDIDHFKQFNDRHGHTAGDGLLESVGFALIRLIRAMDIACRYGGEEFIMVMPDIHRQHMFEVAERLRIEIAKSVQPEPDGIETGPVTVSLGIATLPENGSSAQHLIDAADTALYKAKNSGRNRSILA